MRSTWIESNGWGHSLLASLVDGVLSIQLGLLLSELESSGVFLGGKPGHPRGFGVIPRAVWSALGSFNRRILRSRRKPFNSGDLFLQRYYFNESRIIMRIGPWPLSIVMYACPL
jgi:hypothetical protein